MELTIENFEIVQAQIECLTKMVCDLTNQYKKLNEEAERFSTLANCVHAARANAKC